MGLFNKLFGKKDQAAQKVPKGFVVATVADIKNITPESVSVSFDIPADELAKFTFIPGQYISISVAINGKEERRSYSICSAPSEKLTIGVKRVENGKVSSFVTSDLKVGDELLISYPEGNFKLNDPKGNYVAFAAGSGITPILSIAKTVHKNGGKLNLFYGNKTNDSIMFADDLKQLSAHVTTTHFLSKEKVTGVDNCRLDNAKISEIIKADIALLRADGFFLCGPEEMIVSALETLKVFGVSEDKIIYELFTTPVLMKSNETEATAADFHGTAAVEVELDGEIIKFDLPTDGKNILDALTDMGEDAPYSCKGGVCCTCKAKVTEGKATMKMNYSLTDSEVANGYVLTCQAHPASEKLKLSYDA